LTKKRTGGKIIFEDLNIMRYKIIGMGLVIIAGIFIWQGILILSPKQVTVSDQKQAGEVSVEANYSAGKSDEDKIVFEVSLNTHSVDLDGIDFQKTVLMQKDGQTSTPLAVEISGSGLPAEASAKAGHHRWASVKFNRVSPPLKIIFLGTPEIAQQEFMFDELK